MLGVLVLLHSAHAYFYVTFNVCLGVGTTKENDTYACLFVLQFYSLVNTLFMSSRSVNLLTLGCGAVKQWCCVNFSDRICSLAKFSLENSSGLLCLQQVWDGAVFYFFPLLAYLSLTSCSLLGDSLT